MTTQRTQPLTERQAIILMKVLAELLGSETCELSGYALETRKCGTPHQLDQLVAKGKLSRRMGTMILPTGPYAGEEIAQPYYSVA